MARAKKFSPLDRPDAFAQALVDWFDKGGKDYPWRRTHDPYAVLVSELMLQQTQVATVLSRRYFENWLEKFPTPGALAQASEEEVLKAWEGLGYYRRARNLQKAAIAIVAKHSSEFPRELESILALPGVGPYTAGAVASFAFGDSAAIVDGNVARVLARLFDFHEEIDSTKGLKALWAWAEQLVPQEGAREYNSGLMELGQTLCSVTDPQCGDCPVAAFCLTETPSELPKRKPRVKTTLVDEHVRLVVKGGRVLLEQESGKRREGLWKLPELPESKLGVAELLHEMKYSITRYRVTLHVYADRPGQATPPQGQEWFDESQIAELAMPSPYRKALVALAESGRIFA
ncbi:MAG: A/G-specific adenine glycosylase [Verrucomicrobiales bacterium]